MNYQKQTLLTAIKASVLHQHIQELSLQSRPLVRKSTPFEIYQYEEGGYDYEELEQKMKEDILCKFNEHLYEEECSKLQMELFSLEEAIEIQKSQISYLKVCINAHKYNKRPSKLQVITKQPSLPQPVQKQVIPIKQKAVEKEKQKDIARLSIYPCVRVDFDPPAPTIPLLPLKHQQKEVHIRSQRQIRAMYSKRSSHTPSQVNQNEVHQQKSIKEEKKEEDSLVGIKRQIEFVERAWQNARKEGKQKQCKKYKKELMTLISHFWKVSAK